MPPLGRILELPGLPVQGTAGATVFVDRTKGIMRRLEGSFALSCLDLEGHEAIRPIRARAGHQAYGASVRECVRFSLQEGPHP